MGIEVSVVDDSDRVGWIAGASRTGELDLRNVTQMVDAVIGHLRTYVPPISSHDITVHAMSHGRVPLPPTPVAGSARLARLNVLDHGNTSGGEFGSDWVTVSSFTTYQAQFQRLRSWFDQDGYVHLQHCEIGQNIGLLQMFADAFGAAVVGGRGMHNPLYRANFGYYVRVYPAAGGARRAHDTFFWRP